MSEQQELIKLVKQAIKHPRSKEEITRTFQDAGIIDKSGNLKHPYKDLKMPINI